MLERLVVITRRTRLEDLVRRLNSRAQAKFYLEHAGGDFSDYDREDATYRAALDRLRRELEPVVKVTYLDRSYLPSYQFDPRDLIVTVGQDGLVANTAKYAGAQPILALNPDPERFDGILLPFALDQARAAVEQALAGQLRLRAVTMAEVRLNDGQRLLAFNDLFLGPRSHTSARYRIRYGGRDEPHSSSGVIVATGAGSSGWLAALFAMASGLARFRAAGEVTPLTFPWEDPRLVFAVREPFISKHSQAAIVSGMIEAGQDLGLESLMPTDGVIFSDGIEADYLAFNSGAVATVRAADQRAQLVAP